MTFSARTLYEALGRHWYLYDDHWYSLDQKKRHNEAYCRTMKDEWRQHVYTYQSLSMQLKEKGVKRPRSYAFQMPWDTWPLFEAMLNRIREENNRMAIRNIRYGWIEEAKEGKKIGKLAYEAYCLERSQDPSIQSDWEMFGEDDEEDQVLIICWVQNTFFASYKDLNNIFKTVLKFLHY